ncbi:MAG: prepilin-type cleavage/methylation domain-containing protein [Gammaproteobacteria bacterium]|uniref:type IV pilus modification PilV family protein n=1 Tax=Shewanella TaxID=22 RepID=UPI000CA1B36C|nr:prepilin-type cleavage/methylation domain-containing protein [Shewanella sp. Pdp11]MBU1393432.1 prepilin-type cleavage/methylation domain-containing protein [Gammaproteobacteria bacterium]AUD59209.1 prepilin-type N-terminal cleavage/methylation domain-containing protein [Shewanella sp. Pdp11]MBU1479423.1 prepilin-type cleavage/methylation domain-containing protein [Gammaproteobacteria bacterium]MBU2002431.1 prepilin-type cleavage/methylation domain-containing protein [Gammaproteobacteria bac
MKAFNHIGKKHLGFTMTEVLVSLVVSVTSLLALAKAQLSSLQHASNSFQYTVATVQAQNVIEQIWPRLCEVQKQPARFEDINFRASLSQDFPAGFDLVLPATYQDNMAITVTWQDGRVDTDNSVSLNASFPHLCKV